MSKQLNFVLLLTTLAIVSVAHGGPNEENGFKTHDDYTVDLQKKDDNDVINCCSLVPGAENDCQIKPRYLCMGSHKNLTDEEKAEYIHNKTHNLQAEANHTTQSQYYAPAAQQQEQVDNAQPHYAPAAQTQGQEGYAQPHYAPAAQTQGQEEYAHYASAAQTQGQEGYAQPHYASAADYTGQQDNGQYNYGGAQTVGA